MKTKVALIIPTMDRGGAEKQLVLLALGLPKDEFDVHVFLLTRDGPRSHALRDAGIPVTLIGKRFKVDPTAVWRLRNALIRFQPDVVHTWLFAANSFGRVAAAMAGVGRIIASERCVDPWKGRFKSAIDRRLVRWTEAITTNSTGVRDFYAGRGIDPSLFRVIPNGVPRDSGASTIDRAEACRRIGVSPERDLIFAVGRLWPQKRYRDLIWAAELTWTVLQTTTLVILGDGPQRGELLRHRDEVSGSDRVWFVGERDDVRDLLPHGRAFWIGSEYEGQSNALIEAMQAGLPVVATDIPGNRDLVSSDAVGRIAQLGEPADFARWTLDLIDHPEVAERIGRAAAARIADEFTVTRMVDAHAALYRGD